MKLRVLGNAGNAVGTCYTTSVLVDETLSIDAGTGLHRLSLEELLRVKDVVLTHSHLDHVVMLCFLVDVHVIKGSAVRVHCLPETAEAIRGGLLNNRVWPDMEKILVGGVPVVSFNLLTPFESFEVGGRRLTPLPVNHGVPALGYCLHGAEENFVFCSDMIDAPAQFWAYVRRLENFRRMTMEISFPSGMSELARLSHHLTPAMMVELLAEKAPEQVEVLYNHAKSDFVEQIRREVAELGGTRVIRPLLQDEVIEVL